MGRAPCCDKATVKKGPWAPEEDAVLKAYIDAHGTAGGNWIALPRKLGLNRCGKSCRLRWLNYLRPNLRHGGFTGEEDRLICSLYVSIGSRWSAIAAQLPGRTDNDVKNYWNTKLKRRLLGGGRRAISSGGAPRLLLVSPTGGAASALERMRLSVQLQRRHGLSLGATGGGFTFCGNLAAPPWPAPRSLPPASGHSGFWSHIQTTTTFPGRVVVQDHGAWDSGSSTPALSTSTTATGDTAAGIGSSESTPAASSTTLDSEMEDEIDMLLQQIGCFGDNDGSEAPAAAGIDDWFGAAVEGGSAGSWSSCSTPAVDSVLQDYHVNAEYMSTYCVRTE